jgi:fatty-acid desaturase
MGVDAAKLKAIGDRAQELGKLKQHPSWPALRATVQGKYDKWVAQFTRDHLAAGFERDPVDQRHLDYQRGFWAGAFYLLDHPEKAEETLRMALRKATSIEEREA